jgi:hypothetical protein
VTGGFSIAAARRPRHCRRTTPSRSTTTFTLVRGQPSVRHRRQRRVLQVSQKAWARGGGQWNFTGAASGLGLATCCSGASIIARSVRALGHRFLPVVHGVYCAGHVEASEPCHRSTRASAGSRSSART